MMGFREYLIETADAKVLINRKVALARYVARQSSNKPFAPEVQYSQADDRISDISEAASHVG
jgi:hypothetical protein